MQFLFNLAVIASLAYVVLGAERFEHHWNQFQEVSLKDSVSSKKSLSSGLDVVEAKVDRLMQTVETELNDQQRGHITRPGADKSKFNVEGASEDSALDASRIAPTDPPAGLTVDESVYEDQGDIVSEPSEPQLISLSDRAYALDRLLMELEMDVASR